MNRRLSLVLRGWRGIGAVHDPGKVVQDLASAIALGGDCLADIAVVRAQRDLFGSVASDPTVSRLVHKLAADVDASLRALRLARADARAMAWRHRSPVPAAGLVPVDIDGTIVVAHSEKESAAPTFKRTFGFHPLLAFVDHGSDGAGGGGEPLAAVLRAGSANANTAADHIAVLDLALAQLPESVRSRVLVLTDSGGGTKKFLQHISSLGLQYSTGIGVAIGIDRDLLARLPRSAWTAALDSNGKPREGAQVAELTHLLPDLTERHQQPRHRPGPARGDPSTAGPRRRPHPRPQGQRPAQPAAARLRAELNLARDRAAGRRPARLDRHTTLGLTTHRNAEPKRLRLRLLHVAARVVRTGRKTLLKLDDNWPWAKEIIAAHKRLRALPTPT